MIIYRDLCVKNFKQDFGSLAYCLYLACVKRQIPAEAIQPKPYKETDKTIERLHVTSWPVKHRFLPHVLTVNYTKLYKMCGK